MIAVPLFGSTYFLKTCTQSDVDSHYEVVREMVVDTPEALFKRRMQECVDAGTAVALYDNSCFLYYLNSKPWLAEGRALYGKGSPKGLMALVMGTFTLFDRQTFKLDFYLHSDRPVFEYKTLATKSSIQRNSTGNGPVTIRIDLLKERFRHLINYRADK